MLAIFLKPTKVDKYRNYWNIYHHFVGYTLLSLIVINIFKGFAILRPPKSWKHKYIILLIVLASATLVLEIVTWVWYCKKRKPFPVVPPHGHDDVAPHDEGSSAPSK
jgi:hypothetical protein